jgi:hypothetical protein
MRNDELKNINTNRSLQVVLLAFGKRWDNAYSIKDSRRRSKEILRLRTEVKALLGELRRIKQSANSYDKDKGFANKAFRTIASWLSVVEKKHRDV